MSVSRTTMDHTISGYFSSVAATDLPGVLGFLADDAVVEQIGDPGGPLRSKDEVPRFYERLFATTQPVTVTPVRRSYGESFVLDEALWEGFVAEDPAALSGPRTRVTFRLLHVFDFVEDGRISRVEGWLDVATLQVQLVAAQEAARSAVTESVRSARAEGAPPVLGAITDLDLTSLRAGVRGTVIAADEPGYDEARRTWNADNDRRPAVIIRCASTEDVVTALGTARGAGLEVAVRGGAHSFPGHSVCDDGLVVDLSGMNAVVVDAEARTARVQGGALLADLDRATQAHSLAVPTGMVGHTGVGGLTLGGGMGWLTRQAGLAIDNLISAEVVVADGRVLRASADQNLDLFWALRGGGGNFGVVTEFEFRLHEVGPIVQFGLFFWGQQDGPAALRLMREVIADLPRSMNAIVVAAFTAPPAPFVPVEHQGTVGYALMLTGFGDGGEHQRLVDRIRLELPPLFDLVTPMPYVALQSMLDEPNAWGSYGYDKGAYLADLSDEVIEVLTEYSPRKSSPLSVLIFYRLDEAYSEVGDSDTAYGGPRLPCTFGTLVGLCPTREMLVTERAWVRSLFDALRPHLITTGTYVNVLAADESERIRESYGPKYDRLRGIKAHYDPENVFHRNANITPAPIGAAAPPGARVITLTS